MSSTDEEKIFDVLAGIQLDQFYRQIVDKLHVTRFSHFDHVAEEDLDDLGMSKPEQRRLFEALKKARKKTLFGSFRKKKNKNKQLASETDSDQTTTSSSNSSVATTVPASSSLTCLINEKSITLYDMIGNGAFGYVRRGEWITDTKQKIDIAVKCLKVSRDAAFLQMQMDFIKEANAMSLLDHPHIIKMHGIVLSTPLMLVTELAPLGCLLTCLRNNQPKFLISQLCEFVIQVASGMAYLESQHYIHRDIAARNLLLSSYDTVKIGDFGLMRPLSLEEEYYTMNPKGKVPFAWCAPESLKFRKFSHASDVWAFGITVTELFSYGVEPWPGLNGGQILQKVDLPQSERPQKPSHCPSKIYNILISYCWAHDPANRPKFSALQNIFEAIRPRDVRALRSYDSRSPQNLCFEEGDSITVIESSSDSSWWRGQNKKTGRVGMFPCEFIDGGKSSGSSSPNIPRDAPVTPSRKAALSPNSSASRKNQCDCGEKHVYDFPVLLNSPITTPTSPDGTRGSVRSFDNEFIFNAESDSGYSSSADRLPRSHSEGNQYLQKELTSSYENCDPVNYELMGLGIPLPRASRPVPIPDKEHVSPHGVLSDPVSVPHKPTNKHRLSDPNPTIKSGFSKGRISDPEGRRKSGPFTLTRRVSAKKLSSFSVPTKSTECSQCPVDVTNSVKPMKSGSEAESPPPLPPKKSTSRPNSRNSNSSSSPQKSPVLSPRSDSLQRSSVQESFSKDILTFMRSVSSDGFESEALKEAQRALRNLSPSKNFSNDDTSVTQRANSCGIRVRSQTEVLSPSKKSPLKETGVPGRRSNSVVGRTPNDRSKTEISENQESVPRSKSIGSKSLEYENHVVTVRQDLSFENYDNAKIKSVSVPLEEKPQSRTFYENHAITITTVRNQENSAVTSSVMDGDGNESLMKLEQSMTNYDNHRLVKDTSKPSTSNEEIKCVQSVANYDNHKLVEDIPKVPTRTDRVNYENYAPKSVPQNYEKMALRKSFIETENSTESLKADKEVGIGDDSGSYENHSGSKKSQPCYENFVFVEHSDIPEDISRDSANELKCPSYENHGFSELEATGKEALKTEETQTKISKTFQEKDDSNILSKSLPTCCDWKLVKENLHEDGSLSVMVEVVGTPNLRKTSSDGDVSDSKQTKKGASNSRPPSDDISGPVPPPRWKKRAREAKKQQTRWSLTVGGELASVLSNYFHQHDKNLKDGKNSLPQAESYNKEIDNKIDKQALPVPEENLVMSSAENTSSNTSERSSKDISLPTSEKISVSTQDKNVLANLSEQKPATPRKKLTNDIASGSQEVDSLPAKNEAPSSTTGMDSRTLQDTTSPDASEKLTNGLSDVKMDEGEEKPQRPNVLCFENKLAGFAEMFHTQIHEDDTETVDVPALPPKQKSPVSPPRRKQGSKTSQYPRLSRDSTNAKLSFEENRQRYKPCPTNGSEDAGDGDAPPPLPRKVSKTKTLPEVPPRPDLPCP